MCLSVQSVTVSLTHTLADIVYYINVPGSGKLPSTCNWVVISLLNPDQVDTGHMEDINSSAGYLHKLNPKIDR